jgi:hypothetical protein
LAVLAVVVMSVCGGKTAWPALKYHSVCRTLHEAHTFPEILTAARNLVELDAKDKAVQLLREKARSSDAELRLAAIAVLVAIGMDSPDAIPELISALRDENVHYEIKDSTKGYLTEKQIDLLDSFNMRQLIHYHAILALKRIGPAAGDALPVLNEELSRESDHWLGKEAVIRDTIATICGARVNPTEP